LRTDITSPRKRNNDVFVIAECCRAGDKRTGNGEITCVFSDARNRKNSEIAAIRFIVDFEMTFER
jgi:hypothetical protein